MATKYWVSRNGVQQWVDAPNLDELTASVESSGVAGAVTLTPNTATRNLIVAPSPTVTPLALKAAPSQTADLLRIQDDSGDDIVKVMREGTTVIGSDTAERGSGFLKLKRITAIGNVAPEIHFHAQNGRASDKMAFGIGIDVAAAVPSRDLAFFKALNAGGVEDCMYFSHGGTSPWTVGFGWVVPRTDYRMSLSPADSTPTMGGLAIRVPAGSSGYPLALIDSATGNPTWWIAPNGEMSHTGIVADAAGAIGLYVKGAPSQTADLQQWQISSGVARLAVTASGDLQAKASYDGLEKLRLTAADGGNNTLVKFSQTGTSFMGLNFTAAGLNFYVIADANVNAVRVHDGGYNALIINGAVGSPRVIAKGAASQTGDLFQTQDSGGGVGFAVTAGKLPRWSVAGLVQTTVGAAGGASALPATPTKYLKVVDDAGTTLVIPAYAAA